MSQTHALRLYGKNDLRLESFELPAIADDEILAEVCTNSICLSTYKALVRGAEHERVPDDIAVNPIIVGHEFSGTILEIGAQYAGRYREGTKYSLQPALNYPGREFESPGYSFRFLGGHATKVIIPREVMEQDCLLPYDGDAFFEASLTEPVSCIIGAFNVQYHYEHGCYEHNMGIVEGGHMAILGGAGPMGLGFIDYALHGPRKPGLLVVSDIDQPRLDRAESLYTKEDAKANGVELRYLNGQSENPVDALLQIGAGKGFDDVFVLAPVRQLVEQSSAVLAENGCLNFFAGPADKEFNASINFYDVHYKSHHVASNSGGNTNDMRIALEWMGKGKLNPAVMITHVGGLDSAADTIGNLPNMGGGKKLIYTKVSMPLTALCDFEALGERDPFFRTLAEITERNNGLWSVEAERHLLEHAPGIAEAMAK